MKELLTRAIEELPEKERQVLALYYYEELTMKEVGAVMGVGESRVSQIHSMAVVRLRARLAELPQCARSRSAPRVRSAGLERKYKMEKVLNQAEIDAMVRRARGGDASGKDEVQPAVVTVWDVRQAGQIGREQVQSISTLHEGFARNLTNAVGGYLRVEFTAALVSAEHLTYGEVLQRVPEVSYLASCKLIPVGATALLPSWRGEKSRVVRAAQSCGRTTSIGSAPPISPSMATNRATAWGCAACGWRAQSRTAAHSSGAQIPGILANLLDHPRVHGLGRLALQIVERRRSSRLRVPRQPLLL